MSIGNSGRIVIEVKPEVKRRLYSALASEGISLKEWFLKNAEQYLEGNNRQLNGPSKTDKNNSNQSVEILYNLKSEK
jgi:predicted HicB family RNase H-like nuclease